MQAVVEKVHVGYMLVGWNGICMCKRHAGGLGACSPGNLWISKPSELFLMCNKVPANAHSTLLANAVRDQVCGRSCIFASKSDEKTWRALHDAQ